MNEQERREVLTQIDREIDKTREAIRDYRDMSQPVAPDDAIGRVSRMDAINNQSITQAALRQAESKLQKLEHMKTRVDEVNFGQCARCGKPIPIMRLLLVPQSRFCVRCAR